MSALVYRICVLLARILARVPIGTNLGLLHLLMALLCGRFLAARGAVFPALASLGLSDAQVRRSEAALCYGRWQTADLLTGWQQAVAQEGQFVPCDYEGIRPVACDLTAFFRPQLRGLTSKHYVSEAGKALPAVVLGVCAAVGQIGGRQIGVGRGGQTRLGLPRLMLRREPSETEAALQKRLVAQAGRTLAPGEAIVVDAGFSLADLLENAGLPSCQHAGSLHSGLPFVARVRSNQTARRSQPPAYCGRGRRPERGTLVRPLARWRAGRQIAATPPDATVCWVDGKHHLRAEVWESLVLPEAKKAEAKKAEAKKAEAKKAEAKKPEAKKPEAKAEVPVFRLVAVHDPRHPQPLLLASNLSVSAYALWRLYRDRWAIEQLPLSAKPMLGAERAFVFGEESRYRLPELALLAGNLLSYVAATSAPAPVASGFWDRATRPTCGRVRRSLLRVHCWELPVVDEQLRQKKSVTAHLKTGVEAHRRHKAEQCL